jgi:DMSO/TMAO reductase YedYZ molybdopterin-dependent catalytic subunit
LEGSSTEEILPWADLPSSFPPPSRPGIRYTDLSKIATPHVPTSEFFVLQHHEIPNIVPESWKLRVIGCERGDVFLTLEEIVNRPSKRLAAAFECAGNGGVGMQGLVGSAVWDGSPLAPLLRELGIPPDTREVVFVGADGADERLRGNLYPSRFARSLPLSDALRPDVLLVHRMNGAPLFPEHGAPLRLVVPGWYGVTQVKWLERIELSPSRFMGWFMAKEYVTVRGLRRGEEIEHRATSVGKMRLKSVVTRVVRRGARDLRIEGLSWFDGTPIDSVEVRIDGGSWEPATLESGSSPYDWIRFTLAWPSPSAGEHVLVSRARAGDRIQPTESEASDLKATPWENDGQVARRIVL